MKRKPLTSRYYAIYREDDERVFGPFLSENDAEDHAWQFSLRNGVEESYGGSSTEIINESQYQKRFPGGCPRLNFW